MIKDIVLIGAGNIATHLGTMLKNHGCNILQIWSRTYESMNALSEKLCVPGTISLNQIIDDADLYLFCVKDETVLEISKEIGNKKGVFAHTSGSVSINVFKDITLNYGVFYPLQTFSKNSRIDNPNFPICIEGCSSEIQKSLEVLANEVFGVENVYPINSLQRKVLHLAAVFSCNFTNYMYAVSKHILDKEDVSFDLLLPLIKETTKKIQKIDPIDAQTGPAARKDHRVIEDHLQYLSQFPDYKKLYNIITDKITGEK